jgi:hypothetical protein
LQERGDIELTVSIEGDMRTYVDECGSTGQRNAASGGIGA